MYEELERASNYVKEYLEHKKSYLKVLNAVVYPSYVKVVIFRRIKEVQVTVCTYRVERDYVLSLDDCCSLLERKIETNQYDTIEIYKYDENAMKYL